MSVYAQVQTLEEVMGRTRRLSEEQLVKAGRELVLGFAGL